MSKMICAYAQISLTLACTTLLREGLRYRIVDSKSLWPSQCCTVSKSTPAHKHRVANVERSLCSQKLSLSSSALSAHALRQSRRSSFGLRCFAHSNPLRLHY